MPPKASPNAPVALIHGEDDFQVKERARQLFNQWSQSTGSQDTEIIDAQCANGAEALKSIGKLREALQTLPFFGGAKVIWWHNCNLLGDDRTSTSHAVSEALTELAQEFKTFNWQNLYLLISAGKVDKRKTFYKTLDKIGITESFEAWTLDDKHWQANAESLAMSLLRARDVRIPPDALAELVINVGPNRQQLVNEVEKILLYLGDRATITLEDVQAVVTRNKQARAFALGDALGERNLPRLLRNLDEELWEMQFDRQKTEIGLLYGLISKIRMMIFLKELQREKYLSPTENYSQFREQLQRIPPEAVPADKRFNPLSMNPYPLFRAISHARNYTIEELVRAMNMLLECNQRLIFSSLDGALVLQQTLMQIVGHKATRPNRIAQSAGKP